jgi:2-keto-4-pentenoate hydratase/2-oxohepta-3-ene-1,7-dioic acid hydratase in catechol pathway
MKLVRFEKDGRVATGALAADGATIIDFQAATGGDTTRFPLSMCAFLARGAAGLKDAQEVVANAPGSAKVALDSVQLLAPVGDPGKIMCIGQNYRDHCEEQNQPIPERAILFSKYATTINDPNGQVRLLNISPMIDYEAELAVVIGGAGGGGRDILEADALNHVAGYLCANDVTARDIQKGDGQWVRGKSPDGFLPIGPWLVTADEIADPHNLDISLTLNGTTMQSSNTSNLIFRIPYLIAHLSQTMTLLPGDILSTGTPGGVGVFRTPPIFLKPGDVTAITISSIGTLTNTFVVP